MRPVVEYETRDGKRFKVAEDAAAYEEVLTRIDEAMRGLVSRDAVIGQLAGGEAYIRHHQAQVERVRDEVTEIASRYLGYEGGYLFQARVANDSECHGIYRALWRFMCIDAQGREWEQPYYVDHPNEGARAL